MKKFLQISIYWRAVGYIVILLLSSCVTTRAPHFDFRELAKAAVRLDMDIAQDDNHRLYIEASNWMGVPYRSGGTSMRGVDCSGFTSAIYKKVFHKKIERKADDQRIKNCKKISKSHLEEGDLVFFHNGSRKRTASHVGIYLKQGRFIHASSSRGVIVSKLSDSFYQHRWMQGGRVR